MEKIVEVIASVNDAVNGAVWGLPGLILLISTGVLLTVGTKFFQVIHAPHWWKNTIATVFKKDSKSTKSSDKLWLQPSVRATSQVLPPQLSPAAPALCSGCGWQPSLA